MGIITDQALNAILHQQVKQQVFAFAPSSPRSQPQCCQQKIAEGSFSGIVFWSSHRQYWIASPAHHPGFTLRGSTQIADAHGFATTWFRNDDMPALQLPRLA